MAPSGWGKAETFGCSDSSDFKDTIQTAELGESKKAFKFEARFFGESICTDSRPID